MSAAWILCPVAIVIAAIAGIDHRVTEVRWTARVLFSLGLAGCFVAMGLAVADDQRDHARCLSRGGVPSDGGECWIGGERQ